MNIAPGLMKTPMCDALPPEVIKGIESITIRGELGEALHFAQLVEAIIQNGYLNATTINLDDGLVIPSI